MEDLDLDQFILDIEQSAPQDDSAESGHHRCQECDNILEDVDGVFVCPNCSAQDTNIVEYQEPEMAFDESGQPYTGQAVALFEKKKKHKVDYGWAWSTDEAIIHILDLQLDALTKCGLVPEYFRRGVKNLWIKFWVQNIAPYIRDNYDDGELVPISVRKALKLRDIEILFKVKDKVLLPSKSRSTRPPKISRMFGARFYREKDRDESQPQTELDTDVGMELDAQPECPQISSETSDSDDMLDDMQPPVEPVSAVSMGDPKVDNVSILTLNRTIAFIEAAARCLDLPDPIFSSDIIRACNQRVIPFFGAHKTLPEGMKMNFMDKFTFQRHRAPTVQYLNNTACMLLYRIYGYERPIKLHTPKLEQIMKRYCEDMNLPRDLYDLIKGHSNFSDFKVLRNHELKCIANKRFTKYPMYDRWAFAILISQLKRLFVLDEPCVKAQKNYADHVQNLTGEKCFVFYDWIRQISMRLKIVTSYDPYMLYHPMTDLNNLAATPQLYRYLSTLLDDRETAATRACATFSFNDSDFRAELTEFLKNEIPIPFDGQLMSEEQTLERPVDLKHPMTDAFKRTKRFWQQDLNSDVELKTLLLENYRSYKTVIPESVCPRRWSIYDNGVTFKTTGIHVIYDIMPQWPFCFRLLLSIGAYICYCLPSEILQLVVAVEHHMYPQMSVQRRLMRARSREARNVPQDEVIS